MADRLAIFLPSLQGGGAERVMLSLANGFQRRGVLVDLIIGNSKGEYAAQIPNNVNRIELNARKLIFTLPYLVKYLYVHKPKGIISAMPMANLVTIWAGLISFTKAKIIISEHSVLSLLRQDLRRRMRLLFPLMKLFYPFSDGIVCVSFGAKKDLSTVLNIKGDKVTAIHNPVSVPETDQGPEHPWLITKPVPTILSVGRLSPEKAFNHLIEAFGILRSKRDVRLIILGEGREREKLESLIESKGLSDDVHMPGFVENPHLYMRYADVVTLTSTREGFGNILVEAMLCGTPVVATDCPHGPREILDNGRMGRLAPVGDKIALARELERQIDAPLTAGIQEWATRFSIDNAVEEYSKLVNVRLD